MLKTRTIKVKSKKNEEILMTKATIIKSSNNNNDNNDNQNLQLYNYIKSVKYNKKCLNKSRSYLLNKGEEGKRSENQVFLERKSHRM